MPSANDYPNRSFYRPAKMISPLRGVRHTAPYFHDNSAKTLEDVAAHYTRFFNFVTGGFIALTPQDGADMVAFMKLLD
jgi:cytochrome c peroxidase